MLAKVILPLSVMGVSLLMLMAQDVSSVAASPMANASSPALAVNRQSTTSSLNWAGYVATGAIFTDVVGTWTQPPVTCSGKAQYSTFWVGLDGFVKGDKNLVEQVGTDSDCTAEGKKHPSTAYYFAWWDIYPEPFQTLPAASCPVEAGDSMTAEVSSSNGNVVFTMTDSTQGWQCTASESVSPPGLSAEWIVEAPTENSTNKVLPLADYGSVRFTGAAANGTQLSDLDNTAITMQVKGTTKASPSPIGSDGGSFAVTWLHS